jgi:hypothetical protein
MGRIWVLVDPKDRTAIDRNLLIYGGVSDNGGGPSWNFADTKPRF